MAAWGLTAAGASEEVDSFGGSCSLQGTTTFDPPATNNKQPLTTTYDGAGTCTGTLNGRELKDAPVKMHNQGRSNGSCPEANTTEPGHGTLTFADGSSVRYTFQFTSTFTEIDLTMNGERSGSAKSHATFLTARTPPDVTLRCAGEGIKEIPMDLSLTTDSPLASVRALTQKLNLRLSATPRDVPVGRQTKFRFHVTASDGRSVPGAKIWFAGTRVHTGAAGRAEVVTAFHRAGKRKARATKHGFRTVVGAVRAHSPK